MKSNAKPNDDGALNTNQQQALDILRTFKARGAASGDWRKAIGKAKGKRIAPKSFDNWRKMLLKSRQVEQLEQTGKYRVLALDNKQTESATGMPRRAA